MIASAKVAHYARHAEQWGVRTGNVEVDLPKIVARKDRIVQQSRSGLERKTQERKSLHLYRGHARFLGPRQVSVPLLDSASPQAAPTLAGSRSQLLESERIFFNTRSRVNLPRLQGFDPVRAFTDQNHFEYN